MGAQQPAAAPILDVPILYGSKFTDSVEKVPENAPTLDFLK
jgi:hypothetical protein